MAVRVTLSVRMGELDRQLLIEPLREVGARVAVEARKRVPVRTGYLRGTIYVQVVAGGAAGYVCVIGADAHYALYVHEGTGIYGPRRRAIVAAPGKVFRFEVGGDVVFTTRIRGQKPQPFLRDALKATPGVSFFAKSAAGS